MLTCAQICSALERVGYRTVWEVFRTPEGDITRGRVIFQPPGNIRVTLIIGNADIDREKLVGRCGSRGKKQSYGFCCGISALPHVVHLSYIFLVHVSEPWLSGLVVTCPFVPRFPRRIWSWRELNFLLRPHCVMPVRHSLTQPDSSNQRCFKIWIRGFSVKVTT